MHDLIIISSHTSDLEGPTEGLIEYLKNNNRKFVSLLFPLHYCIDRSPKIVTNELIKKLNFYSFTTGLLTCCIRDSILSLFLSIYFGRKSSILFIGIDPLNCFVGLILKSFKLVDKVVYYSIDWTPNRFEGFFLNSIYHYIDYLCSKFSDRNWNLSHSINQVRLDQTKNINKNEILPVGVPAIYIRSKPIIPTKNLVLLGALAPSKGVDLIIETWPLISKAVPGVRLYVIGKTPNEAIENGVSYEPYEKSLQGLGPDVILCGSMPRVKVYEILLNMDLGLALYKPTPGNISYWADPSRIKDYLCCGIPVITTDVPYISKEIETADCGSIISYDKFKLLHITLQYLTNDDFISEKSANAHNYIKNYTWQSIFDGAFKKL